MVNVTFALAGRLSALNRESYQRWVRARSQTWRTQVIRPRENLGNRIETGA